MHRDPAVQGDPGGPGNVALAHQTSAVWWEARGGFSGREKGHWPQHMLDLEWFKNKLRPAEGQGLAQGPQAGCKDRRPELYVLRSQPPLGSMQTGHSLNCLQLFFESISFKVIISRVLLCDKGGRG